MTADPAATTTALMDLTGAWDLLGHTHRDGQRTTYYRYDRGGRRRALIILVGLRREQVIGQLVRVTLEHELSLPVVTVWEVQAELDPAAAPHLRQLVRRMHTSGAAARRIGAALKGGDDPR